VAQTTATPLSHEIGEQLFTDLRDHMGPVVELVAKRLGSLEQQNLQVPTLFTRASHKASAPPRMKALRVRTGQELWSCPDCGGPVGNARRVRCNECIDRDPGQTPEARGRRAKAIAARRATDRAWQSGGGEGTFDANEWPAILEGLQSVKLSEITSATGLSKSFASAVRAGKHRPHPSHWEALKALRQ
jgi:hypothetical protein